MIPRSSFRRGIDVPPLLHRGIISEEPFAKTPAQETEYSTPRKTMSATNCTATSRRGSQQDTESLLFAA